MNLRYLFFALACFGAIVIMLVQDRQHSPDAEKICDLLRADSRKYQASVSSNEPMLEVLFFDINRDGTPDALTSFRVDTSARGCHGNPWSYECFKDAKWQSGPWREDDDPNDEYNDVFARGDDFYSLAVEGEKPKLVLIYTSFGRTYDGERDYTDQAYEITIDDDGYLKTIPIPELSETGLLGSDGDENPPVEEPPSQETLAMRKRLTSLSTEYFLPQGRNENEKTIPAATEGATVQSAVVQMDAQHETQDTPATPSPRQLWLYLALSLGVLCNVTFFLRKTFSKR